ncbi:MAG: biopolymer transporter ExbD [Candidatus Methylacidiphilales bacterium]|nr:biopolymer transporter ExbD [Candidatus Methylacidiphilales bacterium]
MTPLIDVVLLLLIFFILSSSFVLQPGIKVSPPRGVSNSGVRDIQFIVNISAQNPPMIFLNDKVTDLAQLENEFRRIARSKPDATVVLRADAAVTHGLVTEVMSMALSAGVAVVVATKPGG